MGKIPVFDEWGDFVGYFTETSDSSGEGCFIFLCLFGLLFAIFLAILPFLEAWTVLKTLSKRGTIGLFQLVAWVIIVALAIYAGIQLMLIDNPSSWLIGLKPFGWIYGTAAALPLILAPIWSLFFMFRKTGPSLLESVFAQSSKWLLVLGASALACVTCYIAFFSTDYFWLIQPTLHPF